MTIAVVRVTVAARGVTKWGVRVTGTVAPHDDFGRWRNGSRRAMQGLQSRAPAPCQEAGATAIARGPLLGREHREGLDLHQVVGNTAKASTSTR